MAFFKSLFGMKKKEESDGQEEYFREDFAPIVKQSVAKKAATKTAETEKNPAVTKEETKPTVKSEKPAPQKKSAAKAVAKTTEKAVKEKKTASAEKPTTAKKSAAKTAKKNSETKAATKKNAHAKKSSKELSDDSPEVKGAVAISESRATANGKWDIRKAKDGRYFFSLYASNHTVIAYSQIYSSTTAVNTGINSVIANATKCEIEDTTLKKPVALPCPKWEIYVDKAGEYRFRLYAPNGLIVCHSSHGYASKSGCKGGIESIKRFCTEAKVDKSYLK